VPRRPKPQKQRITVVVNSTPITVVLHPPTNARKSWYAYWNGLSTSKSTGHSEYVEAVKAVENMIRNGGERSNLSDTILTDEEFEEIQRQHFAKKTDPMAQKRAAKSLRECLDAISAFKEIVGLHPITKATARDCEKFQHDALQMPKNWRARYPNSRDDLPTLSPTTVDKWSRALQAAWERANRNAGKKCIRSVVPENKLLSVNPWREFSWVERRSRPIRQFTEEELLGVLDYFEVKFAGVTAALTLVKTFLWSWGRRIEVVNLRWENHHSVGNENHFEIMGKAGVEKWFRVPSGLFEELVALRTGSPFVFAAFSQQLRAFHRSSRHPWRADNISQDFIPANLGDWFYRQISQWSESLPNGSAYVHVFRKTSLQYARSGEDLNRLVAADARLTESVMMTNYVKESDPEMRQKSNRTFHRILASLSPEVARRYGHAISEIDSLKSRHLAAVQVEDWELASKLAAEIAEKRRQAG